MAKSNVKTAKKVVEQPETDIQEKTENAVDTAATTEETTRNEQILPVQSGQSNGEETVDERNPEVDSESQNETIGKEGDKVEIYVVEEPEDKTEKRKKIAAGVFAKHSNCKVLYFTSDLIPFFEQSDAYTHTGILKDQTVITFNKE